MRRKLPSIYNLVFHRKSTFDALKKKNPAVFGKVTLPPPFSGFPESQAMVQ